MISRRGFHVLRATEQVEITSKRFSNSSGPGQRAKTVDKPTSNVATRPKRTSIRKPHATTGSDQKGSNQTEWHTQDPNPPILQREGSLILRLPSLVSRGSTTFEHVSRVQNRPIV